MYIATNNGASIYSVEPDYQVQPGEVFFGYDYPTDAQLAAAFPGFVPAAQLDAILSYRAAAQAALDASDVTFLRAQEDEIPWPQAWIDYRNALRVITNPKNTIDPTQPLPARPPYPVSAPAAPTTNPTSGATNGQSQSS